MMTSLINKTATKRFIINKFKSLRPGMPIDRVSKLSLERIEAKLRAWLIEEVKYHPTIGKTFHIE